ncbi:MAG: hypothetical protein ABEJ92_09925 [Halobacteriales archaeon]
MRERASTAFATLGNETRLGILLALWDAHRPGYEGAGLTFSELRERVGVGDSGQFNYHLEKLVGEFVRKTGTDYSITEAGNRIVRAVVGSVGVEEPTPEPVALSHPCPVCGGATEFQYDDGHVFFCCTECPGLYELSDAKPDGVLTSEGCTRSAFAGRDLLEVYDAVRTRAKTHFENMIQGVCPECIGPVTRSLVICDAHDSDGVCAGCGSRFEARIELECVVCKQFAQGPVRTLMSFHPDVLALYIEHDIPFAYEPDPKTMLTPRLWPDGELEQAVLSDEPAAVRVTLEYDRGELAYTIDAALELSDVTIE